MGGEKNGESPHLAGRCLALFRLQVTFPAKEEEEGEKRRGFPGSPGKREGLTNRERGPESDRKRPRERNNQTLLLSPCFSQC